MITLENAKEVFAKVESLSTLEKVYHDLFRANAEEFTRLCKTNKSKMALRDLFISYDEASAVISGEKEKAKKKAISESAFEAKVQALLDDEKLVEAIDLSKKSKSQTGLVGTFDFEEGTFTLRGKSKSGKSSGGNGGFYRNPLDYQYQPVLVFASTKKSSLVGKVFRSASSLFVSENGCEGKPVPSWSARTFLQEKNGISVAYLDGRTLPENLISKVKPLEALKHWKKEKNTKNGLDLKSVQEAVK